jgi:hypothetical protein
MIYLILLEVQTAKDKVDKLGLIQIKNLTWNVA